MTEVINDGINRTPTGFSLLDKSIIENLINPENNKFPEGLFVSVFLPIFAGVTDMIGDKRVHITEWLNVAGNALKSVDIIDTSNNLLFTVPPLLRDIELKGKLHPNDTFFEIMAEYENYTRVHPKMGQRFIENIIALKIPKKPADVRDIRVWNSIFKRYNYPEIELSSAAQQALNSIEYFEKLKENMKVEQNEIESVRVDYDDGDI